MLLGSLPDDKLYLPPYPVSSCSLFLLLETSLQARERGALCMQKSCMELCMMA